MTRVCDNAIRCEGSDFPVSNYSAESPEQPPDFCSVIYPTGWDRGGCMTICCLPESQDAADLCALGQSASCPPDPPRRVCPIPPCPPIEPPAVFYSTGTVCLCVSEGGGEFFYTIPGATFSGPTQAIADALARSYACVHCYNPRTSFRLGEIDSELCIGSPYSKTIPCSAKHRPAAWFVADGALPTGLLLDFSTGIISGVPSVAGTFTFTIQATNSSGNYGRRTYEICVIAITPDTLPDATIGTAYNQALSATGCARAPVNWKIVAGALPSGLTLDEETGRITGVPDDEAAEYSFRVRVQTDAS